jgi:hypothetical protein
MDNQNTSDAQFEPNKSAASQRSAQHDTSNSSDQLQDLSVTSNTNAHENNQASKAQNFTCDNYAQFFDSDDEKEVETEKLNDNKSGSEEENEEDEDPMDELAELVNFSKKPVATQKPVCSYVAESFDDIVVTQEDIEKFLVLPSTIQKPKALKKTKSTDDHGLNQPPSKRPNNRMIEQAESAPQNMPNYVSMGTPDLKSELKKFGIKPLSKKQAVKKLTEIFEYTSRKAFSEGKMPRSQSCVNFGAEKPPVKETAVSAPVPEAATSFKLLKIKSSKKPDEPAKEPKEKQTKEPAGKRMRKNKSDLGLNSAPTTSAKATSTLQNSNATGIEDYDLEDYDEDRALVEAISASQSTATAATDSNGKLIKPKQRASKFLSESETEELVVEFIDSNPEIYVNILNYEPLDLEKLLGDLHALVAQDEKKINTKFVMKILDDMCVTFTLKNFNGGRNNAANKNKSKKKH